MTDLATWQLENNHYLTTALGWLRLRLLWLSGLPENGGTAYSSEQVPMALMPTSSSSQIDTGGINSQATRPNARQGLFGIGRRHEPDRTPPPPANTTKPVSDESIARAASAMEQAADIEPLPALLELTRLFQLSSFEQNLLLLCAAMELDTRTASLCAHAGDDRPYPTFALALALFENATWDALSPERPLRYWRLIEINQPTGTPLTASGLRLDERILNFIKGLNYLDDRLSPLLTLITPPPLITSGDGPDTHATAVDDLVRRLQGAVALGRLPLIHLLGANSMGKQSLAARTAARLGLELFRLPVDLLPTGAGEAESFARLWQRETALIPVALYLDAAEPSADGNQPPQILAHFLTRARSLTFFDTRDAWPEITPLAVSLEVARPPTIEQRAAWTQVLGIAAEDDWPTQLASQFDLNFTTIQQIAQDALRRSSNDLRREVWRCCLASTRPRMEMLAQRIDAKATWGDIVLPDQEMTLLRHIVSHVRQRGRVYDDWGFRNRMNRGLGISVLCAGESGTGKTMAAEVIANDLQLDLYRIDLSAVVSKYIGETEKNLRRLFDGAEDGGAVLFFDEADALFGKRSEVKDSHDRYANIEINYLLQRIEAYRGLALLATNQKSTLDTAFLRRLRFIVNFPFPGISERRKIWQKVFPAETPTDSLDFDRLAQLNLSGGNIHSIALNAAFLAAAQDSPITMPLILKAARIEYIKLERPINEADFRWPPRR